MRIEILTEAQKQLLPLIQKFNKNYYLAGGTAVALHIGHRHSIDFDLFTSKKINRKKIKETIETFHPTQLQLIWEDSEQLHLTINGVKLTFFTFHYPIKAQHKFHDIISIPSLIKLSAMKAFALGGRAKWKDYVDLYFILKSFLSLGEIISEADKLFSNFFSAKLFKEQLTYFKDIDYSEEVIYLRGFETDEKTIKDFLTEIATTVF